MDKYVGKRLDGRYELREIIGIGGMANIYKAYDSVEDREVAVKILKEEFMGNEEFLRNFRNESKAVAALSHPNIVKIYDVNFGDRIQYIVMEHIDGITLKEYIDQCKVLTWKDTVHFTVQILRGLQHAHDKGIVHRDIKPQNIMLLSDGTIKLMDFGIAKFSRDTTRKMQTDKAIGSVHYISPEQARAEDSDEKSDIYSVGVVMYEMLTGRLPFDGETPEQIAIMQMEAIATQPRQLNETIPEGLEEIVVRAMQKDARMRYQSAAEMLRDIDKFKKDPSIVFEYKYFSDEGTTKYFDAITEAKEEDEEEEKKSKSIPILAGLAIAFVLVAVLIVVLYVFVIKPDKKEEVEVPNMMGLFYDDIKKEDYYEKLDIQVMDDSEYNEDYEIGQIYYQDITAGKEVLEGATIKIRVCQDPEMVQIPNLLEEDYGEARDKLVELGLKVTLKQKTHDTIEKDKVISTDPEPGQSVEAGATVTIVYSMGRATQPVYVPDVFGKNEEEARAAIELAGLTYRNGGEKEHTQPEGTAYSQSPAANTQAVRGETVVVYFSSGTSSSEESSTDTGDKSTSFSVNLPATAKGSYIITVTVGGNKTPFVYDGNTVQQVNIPNMEAFGKGLKFSVSGSGKQTVIVNVFNTTTSETKAYATWSADFDNNRSGNATTNSDAFSYTDPNADAQANNSRDWSDQVRDWLGLSVGAHGWFRRVG